MDNQTTSQRQPLPSLMRVSNACEILNCSRARFYELIRSRQLKTVRIGPRGVRVSSTELERFIKEREEEA